MRVGKVSETILKRSILKKIDNKRSEVLTKAGVGADCACLKLEDDEVFVISADPITATSDDIGLYAVAAATNDIAVGFAEPVAILCTALFPTDITEEDIKEMTEELEASCKALNIQLIGGHTEVTDAVTRPILSVTAIGKKKADAHEKKTHVRAGNDVVVTKWIGLEGTSIIAKAKEKDLCERFPSKMIYDAKNFDKYLSIVPEAATAVKSGVTAMHDISEGGVFGALWEFAESSGVGLIIDLKKIPVKQETIEICNCYDINPYELMSGGSLIIATEDGNSLVLALKEVGIPANIIGKCTDNNDRILINGENRRFLEPAKSDELYKINLK